MKEIQKTWNRWQLPVLVLATVCNSFVSATYVLSLLAWAGTALLLYFMRSAPRGGALLGWASLVTSSVLTGYRMIPFPLPVLLIICLVGSGLMLLVFLCDRFATRYVSGFAGTLFFPAAGVSYEYLNSFGGSGTWSSVANHQFVHHYLVQLASVTGIWGISFLLYWFGSVVVWAGAHSFRWRMVRGGMLTYGAVLAVVLLWGAIRTAVVAKDRPISVRIAGISVDNLHFLEATYNDYSGKQIHLSSSLAQTDPLLQEAQKGLMAFVETGGGPRFVHSEAALGQIQDSLFLKSALMAARGAQIVLWSEANAMALKDDEQALIARGSRFASEKHVYLLMALGIIRPGKITPRSKWLENKTVFIGPDGRILNLYYKNMPVPGAEPAINGDGHIPVISTIYGRIGIAICYDADFPRLMQQAGQQHADILLIPSGDWRAIAPLHSYMAAFRGIENGCVVVRQVSHGLSIAALADGSFVATSDYFNNSSRSFVVAVPSRHRPTLYTLIGDSFAMLCLTGTFAGFIFSIVLKRRTLRKAVQAIASPAQPLTTSL